MLSKLKSIVAKGDKRSVAVKKNIAASFALKGISMMVSFLLVPATIGYISSELYGVWLTLSAVLTWIQFLDIGLTQGLKNRLTEALAAKDYARGKMLVSTTYATMVLIFVPISLIGCVLVPYINWASLLNVGLQYQHEIVEVMQLLIFMVAAQMIVNVIVSVVAAFQQVALSQLFTVLGNALAYIVIVVFTYTVPASLINVSLVLAGSPVLITIIGSLFLFSNKYRIVAPSVKHIKLKKMGEIFSLGIKFFIINVQAIVVYQTANLLISNVSSPEAVTSYNIAYKYLSLAMMLYTNITLPLWPAYTDAYAKGDHAWMQSMRHKMNKVLGLCILCCIIFAVMAQPVYSVWIGNRAYVPPTMTWMVTGYVIAYCMMTLNGTFIVGIGKVYLETIVVIIGMIIYIPMAYFFAHYFKEYGIVLALIILNLIYAAIFFIQTNKLLDGTARGIWNK